MRHLLSSAALAALLLSGPAAADTVAQVNMTPRVVVLNPDGSQASFLGGTSTTTANQGTPNAGGANAWFIQWSNMSVAVSALPSLPAGSNVIGAVTQSGGPWTISATALPLPAGSATAANQTATQSAPGTAATTADTIQGSATGVPVRVAGAQWWPEAAGASLAASGTFTGAVRSAGGTAGTAGPYGYFQVIANSTQAGIINISNGSFVVATANLTAGATSTIKVPAFFPTLYAVMNNGATAATVSVVDGFTAN